MSDFNTSKIDGNTVGASEWNQLADVDNFVISSGQTPSTSNLEQLGIGSARYSSGGQFFTDSGTANAYVLTPVSPFKSPVSSGAGEGYFNGMIMPIVELQQSMSIVLVSKILKKPMEPML